MSDNELRDTETALLLARRRVLPATACGCIALGLVALGTGWHVAFSVFGRSASVGWTAIALAGPVTAALALVLLAMSWWRPRSSVPSSMAAVFALIAAIVCWVGGTGVGGSSSDGPAPWLAGFAFLTAAALGALASWQAERNDGLG